MEDKSSSVDGGSVELVEKDATVAKVISGDDEDREEQVGSLYI